jgi:hypothetical protein
MKRMPLLGFLLVVVRPLTAEVREFSFKGT